MMAKSGVKGSLAARQPARFLVDSTLSASSIYSTSVGSSRSMLQSWRRKRSSGFRGSAGLVCPPFLFTVELYRLVSQCFYLGLFLLTGATTGQLSRV